MKTSFRRCVVVLYDGIENSVFVSQVLDPIMRELAANEQIEMILVSFEKKIPNSKYVQEVIPVHDRLHLILGRKLPYFGKLSLQVALWQLVKILRCYGGSEVRARGPLAGYIVLKALRQLVSRSMIDRGIIPSVLIQARGLAAEEHWYSIAQNRSINVFKKIINFFIYKSLKRIEQVVYGYKGFFVKRKKLCIEVVSNALGEYLVSEFHAKKENISLAVRDVTPYVKTDSVVTWRMKKRQELQIPLDAIVYVYSGSFKPWQCAKETVAEAAAILERNKKAFFLVLSKDALKFETEILIKRFDPVRYKIIDVRSNQLMEYLAAADVGFLLREVHIINWVSRPTKMLEYQAVGLEILHNKTIACLAQGKPLFRAL